MYNWKKITFEQILEDYDFMQKELDSNSRSNINESMISINCDSVSLEECEQIIFLLKSSLSTVAILLRAQKAHQLANDITTIDHARDYKGGPVFYTRYVTKIFYQTICDFLFNSERVKLLAFKNMTFSSDFQPICSGIRNNKSLKILFFKNCDISDERCSKISQALRKSPVEVLGLENCNVTSFGISWICWLLKEQSMIRTLAKWSPNKYQNECLYKGEQGLKKLCLNDNPMIGDIGAKLLITSLYDNRWVIQVHMENTGLSNITCKHLAKISEDTKIEVFDVMRNNITSTSLLAVAIERLSKTQSKINRVMFNNGLSKTKQKCKAAINKTSGKHQSEISLSNSDSSCINSTENQRFISMKTKIRSKKTFKAKNIFTQPGEITPSQEVKPSNMINIFQEKEKVEGKIPFCKEKEDSVNNVALLSKGQLQPNCVAAKITV